MLNNVAILRPSNQANQGDWMKEFLNIPQVMTILKITRNAIYKYVAEDALEAIVEKQGGRVVFKFKREEVDRFGQVLKSKNKREKGKSIISD